MYAKWMKNENLLTEAIRNLVCWFLNKNSFLFTDNFNVYKNNKIKSELFSLFFHWYL
jgi:hypothetical protein